MSESFNDFTPRTVPAPEPTLADALEEIARLREALRRLEAREPTLEQRRDSHMSTRWL